uniref:Ima1 N-terminal domain-containing protein n=1 Tax=Kwoniella dejecticola CBS 10117 TaxID=1296121 RepID=A0A1A5ZVJ7_9TREE|nr:uncharacterized protein I303_07737 [Kwoniella dejecticola CBS 10117]OBR81827.1 hypothetical protein I303_07737 [Kwoniella dejecticola CBS 10117]
MPLLRSSTRPVAVQCFFCLSPSLLPPHPSTFDRKGKGKSRIAERGEMISDLPAMHDTAYNERSFSLRATPSSSHLPSSSSSTKSPFCHSCLANQTLIMNMLANYLPDDDDFSYPSLYSELPNYLVKLQYRYPPVCRNCQPAVDEALRKSDHRAQVQAWTSALDRGARTAGPSASGSSSGVSRADIVIWRLRGLLWWVGLGLSIGLGLLAAAAPSQLQRLVPNDESMKLPYRSLYLLLFHSLSVLWIAWDPYWLRRMRHRDKIKVEGRGIWVRNMLFIMILRVISSVSTMFVTSDHGPSWLPLKIVQVTFAVEIALITHSLMSIRISQPVQIKLVRPVSLTSTPNDNPIASEYSIPSHPASPTNHLSSLSLSNTLLSMPNPMQAKANPIFGQASLHQPVPEPQPEGEPMDWEPTQRPYQAKPMFSPDDEDEFMFNKKENWDKFGMGKQRMFHNQNETGLENLLAGWGINNNNNTSIPTIENSSSSINARGRSIQMKGSNYVRRGTMQNWEIAYHTIKQSTIALILVRVVCLAISFSAMSSSAEQLPNLQAINSCLLIIESINTILQALVYWQYRGYTSTSLIVKTGWAILDLSARMVAWRNGEGSLLALAYLPSMIARQQDLANHLIWGLIDLVGMFVG